MNIILRALRFAFGGPVRNVYHPPTGPYRHGVDPPEHDPHRDTPDDQVPRWHPRYRGEDKQ